MFSWKKKSEKKTSRQKPGGQLNLPGVTGLEGSAQDNDADLEAELFALTGGTKNPEDDFSIGGDDEDSLEAELAAIMGVKKSGRGRQKPLQIKEVKLKREVSLTSNLSDGDDDEIDENDPDLLNELQLLTAESDEEMIDEEENVGDDGNDRIPSQLEMIQMRLVMYVDAEKKAKASNDSSRARRFNRGVKTLEKLVKRAASGEVIPVDEIPPEIAMPKSQATPTLVVNENIPGKSTEEGIPPEVTIPAKQTTSSVSDNEDEAKRPISTFSPKPTGSVESQEHDDLSKTSIDVSPEMEIPPQGNIADNNSTSDYTTQPSSQVKSVRSDGGNADDNLKPSASFDLPPKPPSDATTPYLTPLITLMNQRKQEYKISAVTAKREGNKEKALAEMRTIKLLDKMLEDATNGLTIDKSLIPPSPTSSAVPAIPQPSQSKRPAPPPPQTKPEIPTTIMQALNQRLQYYSKSAKKAETLGQRAVAKKCADVARLYQNAITLHSSGKSVPFEKLPTPPGYPPIPLGFSVR